MGLLPKTRPLSAAVLPWYMCRSEPQMAVIAVSPCAAGLVSGVEDAPAVVTLMIASSGCSIFGSSTSLTLTLKGFS